MKKWIIKEKKTDDIIDQLLINRGVDLKHKEQFLNLDFEKNIFNAFDIPGMEKAVARIEKAIKNKEKIGIFADYDADGIPGAAILYRMFKLFNTRPYIYIPTREEGYGMNEQGIRYFKQENCSLIITVDLGIVNDNEIKLAKELSIDVVVTDHHEIQKERIPQEAIAIVHPRFKESVYKNGDLSGGAIAWKLAWAILAKIKGDKYAHYAKWWLDLAAITLVCDHMIIAGKAENIENRTMLKYGLKVLRKTKNLGLQKLFDAAMIDKEKIDTYTIGFQIGPRINAPGRMDHGAAAYYLLIEDNVKEAIKIANRLNEINSDRQKELEKTLSNAKKYVRDNQLNKKKIILVCGKNWSTGIIGLVAGKLMELYSRPCIVFTENDGNLQGSGRSISEFNLMDALLKTKKYLTKFGGHKVAAGINLKKNNFNKFYQEIEKIANKELMNVELISKLEIDMEIMLNDINFKLLENLKKMEPFGVDNERPLFVSRDVIVKEKRMVGKDGKHLKMAIHYQNNQNNILDCIGFNLKEISNKIKVGNHIDIVYTVEENIWNGKRSLQLKIIDIRKEND